MLTQVSSLPGLYWEDVFLPRPALPLTGVPTFLAMRPNNNGISCLYEVNQPQIFHLWTQFEDQFTASTPGSWIADAVRGFFENGGRDCVVIWLLDNSKKALEEALTASEVVDADLICAPGTTDFDRQVQILQHCARMGDRFAILDTPNQSDLTTLDNHGKELRQQPGSDYGAVYGPWLKTPHTKDKEPVPPCGHIAGLYASGDRANIPRAPANIALEGVLDVADLSRDQQTQLAQFAQRSDNPIAINAIRSLRGRGVRVWGARTLSSDPQWKYVNVRRLAIMIRRWIHLNLADVPFEPNDFRLWVRIERELNAYLETLWQRGQLQGATPSQAFRVHCNGEINPPEARDRGKVITQIEFAPTIPNEFIQLRLIHGETGVGVATS
jgi:phage tail sheath protein FI